MSSRRTDFSKVPGTKQIIQGVLSSKANAEYKTKKLWRELSLPTSSFDLDRPNIFSMPDKLLRHSAKLKPLHGPHEKKRRRKVKSEEKFNFLLKK
jgi:hypothetical protein